MGLLDHLRDRWCHQPASPTTSGSVDPLGGVCQIHQEVTVVLIDTAGDDVGDRVLVHYKLMFDPDADRRVLTQTVVCTVHDGLVGRMDLVCSGFRSSDD